MLNTFLSLENHKWLNMIPKKNYLGVSLNFEDLKLLKVWSFKITFSLGITPLRDVNMCISKKCGCIWKNKYLYGQKPIIYDFGPLFNYIFSFFFTCLFFFLFLTLYLIISLSISNSYFLYSLNFSYQSPSPILEFRLELILSTKLT